MGRSLAAASVHSGEGGSEGERVAKALASYIGIADEFSAKPEHAEATKTAEWRLTTEPLLALKDLATAFGYVVAERASIPGANEWIQANAATMRQLEAALDSATAPAP